MTERTYKRRLRSVLIHRPMQREFTLVVLALLVVSSLAIGFVIHDTIREASIGGGFRFGKINPYEVLAEVRSQLILRVACIMFVTLIVTGVFTVFFLHRVAGPVYRFRQSLMKLNEGEWPPVIRLREGDFFQETADEVNRLMDRWRKDRDQLAAVRQKLNEILASASGRPGELEKSLQEVKALLG